MAGGAGVPFFSISAPEFVRDVRRRGCRAGATSNRPPEAQRRGFMHRRARPAIRPLRATRLHSAARGRQRREGAGLGQLLVGTRLRDSSSSLVLLAAANSPRSARPGAAAGRRFDAARCWSTARLAYSRIQITRRCCEDDPPRGYRPPKRLPGSRRASALDPRQPLQQRRHWWPARRNADAVTVEELHGGRVRAHRRQPASRKKSRVLSRHEPHRRLPTARWATRWSPCRPARAAIPCHKIQHHPAAASALGYSIQRPAGETASLVTRDGLNENRMAVLLGGRARSRSCFGRSRPALRRPAEGHRHRALHHDSRHHAKTLGSDGARGEKNDGDFLGRPGTMPAERNYSEETARGSTARCGSLRLRRCVKPGGRAADHDARFSRTPPATCW